VSVVALGAALVSALALASGSPSSGPAAGPGLPAAEVRAKPARSAPLVVEGQPGRQVLGGRWYFRLDDRNAGLRRRYMRQRSLKGWRAVSIPYDWNGSERRHNRSSVGWYRRELRVRRSARGTRWIVRFEGAGHQSTVYLNGREIGRHSGSYLPFEADLRGLPLSSTPSAESLPLPSVVEVLDHKRIPLNREERARRPGEVPYYGATGQVGTIDKTLFDEELVFLGEDGVAFLDQFKRQAYVIEGPSWVNNFSTEPL